MSDAIVQEQKRLGPNRVTILPGTPNAHTFYFENPQNPTANDKAKVREFYGIPQEVSEQEAMQMLSQFKGAEMANIISDIPYAPGTKNYFAEIAQRVADVNQRMKLIEDPANYYFKQGQQLIGLDRLIPDQLVSKPAFEMAGALTAMGTAGVLTAPTGGSGAAVAKILGADFLGAQAGGYLYELTNQMLRHLNDLPKESLELQSAKFLKDAYLNLAFSGGAMTLGPLIKAFKPAVGRILFGLDNKNPEYQKMLEVAETYGMPLGIIQATNSGFWKGYSQVLGIFPFVGTPFRTAGEGTNEAIRQYFDTVTRNFAPLQTMASLGGDISKLARAEYEDTMRISRALYEGFEEYSEKLAGKKVIKLDTLKQIADQFATNIRGATPGTGGYQFRFPGDASRKSFEEFYQTMSRLDPDGITIDQARTLQELFSDFAANFKTEGKGNIPTREGSRITKLMLAMNHDFNKLVNIDDNVDKVVFDTAMRKLTMANEYLANVMPKYDNPAASQFKMVNANIFGPGPQSYTQGVITNKEMMDNLIGRAMKDEELMGAIMRLAKTPDANLQAYKKAGMKEGVPVEVTTRVLDDAPRLPNGDMNPNFGKLKTVTQTVMSMGPEAGRKQIMRKIFDKAISESYEGLPVAKTLQDYKNLKKLSPEDVYKYGYKTKDDAFRFRTVQFDPDKFSKSLGLDTVDGRAAMEEALKGTGTKLEDIMRFLDIAERAGSFIVSDPSKFVTRRVTLGGFNSLILFGTGATAGGMLGGGLSTLMIPLLLRYGSGILTNPKVLKSFSKLLQDTGGEAALRTGVTKELALSEEDKKVLLDWAARTLPTESELEELDFHNQVEQSILSLMKEPQKEIEMKSARDQQLEMMERMFGPSQSMTQEELDIGKQLEEKLAPTFNENLGTESPNQFNIQGLLKPNVRNELSLGSLDDAIGEAFKNRGIGALS